MKNTIRQRTPLETGQVIYSINGVGDFTLGYSPGRHPEDDPLNLLVMYGRADDTDIYRGLDEPRPAAPHLYGIDVIGTSHLQHQRRRRLHPGLQPGPPPRRRPTQPPRDVRTCR